jgi:hypothetical protein
VNGMAADDFPAEFVMAADVGKGGILSIDERKKRLHIEVAHSDTAPRRHPICHAFHRRAVAGCGDSPNAHRAALLMFGTVDAQILLGTARNCAGMVNLTNS